MNKMNAIIKSIRHQKMVVNGVFILFITNELR